MNRYTTWLLSSSPYTSFHAISASVNTRDMYEKRAHRDKLVSQSLIKLYSRMCSACGLVYTHMYIYISITLRKHFSIGLVWLLKRLALRRNSFWCNWNWMNWMSFEFGRCVLLFCLSSSTLYGDQCDLNWDKRMSFFCTFEVFFFFNYESNNAIYLF